ncbi:unnamed protein product [Meloidogyne enterolobii]|uniref:Uncharacterized protein n=1 Tax=Meloidogyne enterolobii TaxID=390850 RepID=A0ACB1A5B7_MELEN
MKYASLLIFIAILWAFVKTVSIRKSLAKRAEKDHTATEILNDGAESSVNPQIEKYKETLTKNDTVKNNEENKVFTKSEQNKEYYKKNKERLVEKSRKYRKQNKEMIKEKKRNYYKRNKKKYP